MTDPTAELEVQAKSFQIVKVVDPESFDLANAALRSIKEFLRRVADLFDPIDAAQIAARKTTIVQRKSLEDKPKALELAQKAELVAYEQRQAAIRREAEALAERERRRIEEDARIQAALEAESRGEAKMAEAILEAPHPPMPVFAPPAIVPEAPKAEGLSFRSNFHAEVTDLPLLVKAVAAGEAPIGALLPNLPMLNQMARAMKQELRLPGVRVVEERIASQKG